MEQFEPTKKQLEELAKVAKLEIDPFPQHLNVYFWHSFNRQWIVFEPHENRDQIAMIIEGLSNEQKIKYESLIIDVWLETKQIRTIFIQTVHPSISCQKLLEVIDE